MHVIELHVNLYSHILPHILVADFGVKICENVSVFSSVVSIQKNRSQICTGVGLSCGTGFWLLTCAIANVCKRLHRQLMWVSKVSVVEFL